MFLREETQYPIGLLIGLLIVLLIALFIAKRIK